MFRYLCVVILALRKRGDSLNIDYEFAIILVSELRHQIVHAHGYANKKEFVSSRLKERPLANISKTGEQDYADLINLTVSQSAEGRIAALKSGSKCSFTICKLRFFARFCLALHPLIAL